MDLACLHMANIDVDNNKGSVDLICNWTALDQSAVADLAKNYLQIYIVFGKPNNNIVASQSQSGQC